MVTRLLSDDVVLDCYRLAAYYHLDPRIFLDMPVSELYQHMANTARLERSRHPERKDDDN